MIQCKPLIPLQDLDLKIDTTKSQIEEKKQKVVRMHTEIEADAQLLEKKQALLKKIQLRRRKAETEFNELNQSVKGSDFKLQSAGLSPAAYKALEKELTVLRAKASEEESKILADMEKIETLDKDTIKSQKVLAGRREHLEQIKVRIADEIRALKKDIDIIQTERSQVSLKIDADLLEIYEEIRRQKHGQAVFAIEVTSCPACGMGLPAGFISSLSTHDGAENCSNCGVLLYWTGLRD